jgi:hypothetical protein
VRWTGLPSIRVQLLSVVLSCRNTKKYSGLKKCATNAELHNLYSAPIRMINSRRIRWAGHITRMESKGIYIGSSVV